MPTFKYAGKKTELVSTQQTKKISILAAIGAAAVGVAIFAVLNMQVPSTNTGGPEQQTIVSSMQGSAYADFVNQLKSKGATVQPGGKTQQDMFTINPYILLVNNHDIWVFEYPTEVDAKDQMNQVSPDGTSVGGRQIQLIAAPHFFEKGNLLVFYEGSDQNMLNLLESMLGPQVAG